MANPYKDLIVDELDGKPRYNFIDRQGRVVLADVREEIASPVLQQGDNFGAKEVNTFVERSDDGTVLTPNFATPGQLSAVAYSAAQANNKGYEATVAAVEAMAEAKAAKAAAGTAQTAANTAQQTANAAVKTGAEAKVDSVNLKNNAARIEIGTAQNGLFLQNIYGWLTTDSHFVPAVDNYLALGSAATSRRWRSIYLNSEPNVSCGGAGKKQVKRVKFGGKAGTGEISAAQIAAMVEELPIRAYRRYEMRGGKRVLSDGQELGIYIDDMKDSPLFPLIGRVDAGEDGKEQYSMGLLSYASLALVAAKEALRRQKALEKLLKEKGILTEEEIDSL